MVQAQTAAIDFNTAATQTLVPAVAGKRIAVFAYVLVNGVATAQTIQFKSNTTNLGGVIALPSSVGGGVVASTGDHNLAWFVAGDSVALTMVMSAATQVGGHLVYQYV